ncbi:hypothetical protein [Clostridium disporicum]|uniref:Uncharacterized protein n=1 Tax=Clostridium disporicum TaxID=84024 RepID=A0A174DM63_9CLOT|nr:hypothetical protein [Clostridium disporicum]CUO26494.1 Uncharacterised protein [Clostridium disporicum]
MARPIKPVTELSKERLRKLSPYEIQQRQEQEQSIKEVQQIKSKRVSKNIKGYIKNIKNLSGDELQLIEPLLIELQQIENILSMCKEHIEKHGILDRLNCDVNPTVNIYDKFLKQKLSLVKELNNIIRNIKKNKDDDNNISLDALLSQFDNMEE